MLTVSLENDYRAGQVKRTSAGQSEKQNTASDLGVVGWPAFLGNTFTNEDAARNRRTENSRECDPADDEIQSGGDHLFFSPVARIILAQHAEVVKLVEMTLLGAIVFSICFAMTAGI
ncbi:hypothetical protein [Agrobacterium tumefaciens]|uniref:hypothetical protein n=1 Tax=Agrobacterium tumefaciens TaxID=358 RepID=UPI0005561C0E